MSDNEVRPKSVLVVDDDTFLLNMYSLKFKNQGIETSSIQNGKQVLDKLRNKEISPDVILLDIIMPDINGLEILEKMREENLADNTVIIMLTNQGNQHDIDKAKELGVAGYIVKATTIPSEVVSEVMEIFKDNKSKN